MDTIVSEVHTAPVFRSADDCRLNLHLRGIWTHMCHVDALRRTSWQVLVLCRWGKKWVVLCLFVHKTKNSRRPVFTAGLHKNFLRLFFLRHDGTSGCNRRGCVPHFCVQVTLDLNRCYGNHWIGYGGPLSGHPVHRTWWPFISTSENTWSFWFVTGKRRQVMNSYGVSWTVKFSCVTIMKAYGKRLALFSN
jgi:hypothetical protein